MTQGKAGERAMTQHKVGETEMTQTADKALEKALAELRLATGVALEISSDSPDEDIQHIIRQIRAISGAYREKYDKNHFFFSLMTDPACLASDVKRRAQALHIEANRPRVLFLLKLKLADEETLQILSNLVPHPRGSHIIPMDDRHAALLMPDDFQSEEEKRQVAATLVDTLNAEALQSVQIAVSSTFRELIELPAVFRETSLTLRVGSLFYSHMSLFMCGRLGVGRLIYGLPHSLCRDFLTEIFHTVPPKLEADTVEMMNCFFQNSLRIAETARQLHMHRNTLLYRLEQLEKLTGLDVRTFDGAMTFKLAMMLISYLHERTGESESAPTPD